MRVQLCMMALLAALWGAAGVGQAQSVPAQSQNRVNDLWMKQMTPQTGPPDVISAEVGRWYLSTLYGLASQSDVVAVCNVTMSTRLQQRVRLDFPWPAQLMKYLPWLPPQMEPADAMSTVQVEEGLMGANKGDAIYVYGSFGAPGGEREASHPQLIQGERVLLFLRGVQAPGAVVPGQVYACVSGLSGAWALQWPSQPESPMWTRDQEAVKAVVASLKLPLADQLKQAQAWAQSDNVMLRMQGVICAIAMDPPAQLQAVRDGFAWEYSRYSALCLIWLLNDPALDQMVTAQFSTYPDSLGWMSLKIALPIIDRDWARRRQAAGTQ